MNGVAYPFVTCNDIPSSIEKIKNMPYVFCPNNLNAFSPNDSYNDMLLPFSAMAHCGNVMAYSASTNPKTTRNKKTA